MNKNEFVEVLSKRLNFSEMRTEKVLREIKNSIIEILNKGGEIKISNFGKFKVLENKERLCLNPITKRYFFIEKRKKVSFKAYKNFKFSIK